MNKCEKMNCGYWFKGDNDLFPCCHCDEPEGYAPCEYENDYEEEE